MTSYSRSFAVLLVVLLPFLGGCEAVLAPERDIRIEMSHSSYELDGGTVVVEFTVRNTGGHTLYLTRCGDRILASIDRKESGRWTQYSWDWCQAVYVMVPSELNPGEEIHESRTLTEAGIYRVRVGVKRDPQSREKWLLSESSFAVES